MSFSKLNFSKLASAVIALLLFTFLALITTNTQNNIQKINFKNFDGKDKSIILLEKGIEFYDFDNPNAKYKQKTVSLLDKVFYLESEKSFVKVSQDAEKVSLEIGEGLYYFSFWDLNKGHTIKNSNFELSALSSGKFFIDTRDVKSYKIASFDSVLDVDLIAGGEVKTDVSVYPHMLFKFQPSRNKLLKNADLLRVDSLNSILYFQEPILEITDSIDFEWLNAKEKMELITSKILYKLGYRDRKYEQKDKNWEDFLNFVKEIYISDLDYSKKQEDYLSALEISNLTAVDLINKYFNYFQNNQKKVIYYKNIVLKKINNLYQKSVKYNKSSVNDLYNDLITLKGLSEEDYEELVQIIDWYYEVISINSNVENSYKKRNFSLLLSKINKVSVNSLEEDLYLSSVYSSYDVWAVKWYELATYLNNYFKVYFLDSRWNLKKDIDGTTYKALSFYFGKIIKTKLDLDKEWIISNIDLIKNYKKLNDKLIIVVLDEYKNDLYIKEEYKKLPTSLKKRKIVEQEEKLKKNFVFEYVDIFNSIITSIDENYFKKDENGKNKLGESEELIRAILTPSQDESIKTLYNLLLNWDNSLDKFIDLNKGLFWENKKKIIYKKKKNDAEEYFLALTNYDKYLSQKQNEFLEKQWTLEDEEEDNSLNLEKLEKFLSQFEGIEYGPTDLELSWNWNYYSSHYKVKLTTVWKSVSFDLTPRLKNKIDNFIINWEASPKFFELDDIKIKWEENSTYVSGDDRDKFTFEKFFINTFSEKFDDKNANDVSKDDKKEINPVKARLIGDKLLNRQNWDFRKIDFRKFVFSVYNITVEPDHFWINDVKYYGSYNEWRIKKPIEGTFSGKYYLTDKLHDFTDITLKFYRKEGSLFVEEYGFDGLELKVIWNIHAFDFEEDMAKVLNTYEPINDIYRTIYSKVDKISNATYNLEDGTLNVEALRWDRQKYNIIIDSSNNITRVLKNWKNIISGNISLNRLNTINFD